MIYFAKWSLISLFLFVIVIVCFLLVNERSKLISCGTVSLCTHQIKISKGHQNFIKIYIVYSEALANLINEYFVSYIVW